MARFRSPAWQEVFDTGPIPQQKVSSWDRIFSTLAVAAISAYAYQSSTSSLRTLSSLSASSPKYQTAALNAMTMQSLASQSSYLMMRGVTQGLSPGAVEPAPTTGAASFFVMKDKPGLRLLRVDLKTGAKTPTVPYHEEKGLNTIVDDFRGLASEIREHTLTGSRYQQDEQVHRQTLKLSAFSWGMECTRRAAGLEKAQRTERAIDEYRRAAEQLHSALDSDSNPSQESAIRVNLGSIYSRLAVLETSQAASYRDKAEMELKKVVALCSQPGDGESAVVKSMAEKLLGDLSGTR
jgi:hypothetical protein